MTTPVAPLRSDAARNRALVLDAAGTLLAERGLDVSMQEIAAAAGVGVGTVFRRFATKDELVAAVVRERMLEVQALAARALEEPEGSTWDAFAAFFVATAEHHARHRGFMEAICDSHLRASERDPINTELVSMVREIVARAQTEGSLRADLVAEDIPMLLALVSRTSCTPWACGVEEAWRRPCALVLDGLRADAARTTLAPILATFEQLHADA